MVERMIAIQTQKQINGMRESICNKREDDPMGASLVKWQWGNNNNYFQM